MKMTPEEVEETLRELVDMGIAETAIIDGEEHFRLTEKGWEMSEEMGLTPEDLERIFH